MFNFGVFYPTLTHSQKKTLVLLIFQNLPLMYVSVRLERLLLDLKFKFSFLFQMSSGFNGMPNIKMEDGGMGSIGLKVRNI